MARNGQLDNGAMNGLAMALQCRNNQLGDVAMDDSQWTARNEWLAMDGSAMERWTARDGQLAMDSSQWTGWQWSDGRLGNGAMDKS